MCFINLRMKIAVCCLWLAPLCAEGCASCGCTLDADAATGFTAAAGWRASLEYDLVPQSQLRSGSHAVAGVPSGFELERDTTNRYVTTGIDFSPDAVWGVGLRIPWVMRTHSTYGEYDPSQPQPTLSHSRSSSLGDVKFVGNYQGVLQSHNLGVQFGVKVPTGQYGESIKFNNGPLGGEPLDASLQPGTGSTDLIVGIYYYKAVSQDVDLFGDAQFQSAVKSRQDRPGIDYRPGNSTTVRFGLRYVAYSQMAPQLQFNLLHKLVDQGALADIYSTAGYVAYLSPGLSVRLAAPLQVFAFAQLPIYSDLVGYQLIPRYTATVGASYAF